MVKGDCLIIHSKPNNILPDLTGRVFRINFVELEGKPSAV